MLRSHRVSLGRRPDRSRGRRRLADRFKIKIACTATSDCASAMIARDEGIFAKHGLDAEMTLIGINTNIPPAIASDSIQVGGPTSPVFLQAVDGGLDLVAIAGASVMDPVSNDVHRRRRTKPGLTIKEAKDFIGKKVGAPGIGAYLHVLFRKWLIEKGVDPNERQFRRSDIPDDERRAEVGRRRCGADRRTVHHAHREGRQRRGRRALCRRSAPHRRRSSPMSSTRASPTQHPDVVKAFRESIAEAAPIVKSDRDKAAEAMAKFTKMPIDLVKTQSRRASPQPALKAARLRPGGSRR